jgi:hypothetical protein
LCGAPLQIEARPSLQAAEKPGGRPGRLGTLALFDGYFLVLLLHDNPSMAAITSPIHIIVLLVGSQRAVQKIFN